MVHPHHQLACLALLCLAGTATGGPLADPTRPPAALTAPGGLAAATLPHRANADTARAIAAAARAAEPPPASPPAVLQAVQLPAQGTASALVDGRAVKVGDAVDGRAILAIDAQGLLLKGPRGPERLWLLAGTPKQAAGSLTGSATARYQPAAPVDPATSPNPPAALSLAGRTAP